MNQNTKTLLIVGGVALAAFLIYKRTTGTVGARASSSGIGSSTAGTGNSVSAATGQGSGGETSFWNTLGAAGKGLNAGVSSVESLYNSAQDLFGGGPSSTNTGQGNNGTAG